MRTRMLIGDGVDKLAAAGVAVFGLGGVGGYAVEALARAGVGRLLLIDCDTIAPSNLNRQVLALHSTLGQLKTQAAKARVLDINPAARVETFSLFYGADTADAVPLCGLDYILDAVDTVSSKLLLVERASALGVPIISCMGTGNKLDATKLEVADIYETSVCPLARVMRAELKKRGIPSLRVVYSREIPIKPADIGTQKEPALRRSTPGSVAFVPSVAGLIMAGEAIKAIAAK